METERIALSQRERDRLRVLHEVKREQLTQSEAARRLKISKRHIRTPRHGSELADFWRMGAALRTSFGALHR